MHSRRARNFILGLALVLGQWLVLAHAIEHPALSPEQVCQICLHAQGLDSGAIAPSVAISPAFEHGLDVTPVLPVAAAFRRTFTVRARGPPSLLA